jgi:hypothetical protein
MVILWWRRGGVIGRGRVGTYLFLPPTRMVRSGRSLESAAAVEPPTRPVPPSTSTRAVLEDLFVWAEGAPTAAAAGGAQALTMPMAAAITLMASRRHS